MRKIILYSFLVSFLLFSCNKNHKTDTPDKKTYEVKFNLPDFKPQILNNAAKKTTSGGLKTYATNPDTSNTDTLNVLYYMVFDSNKRFINLITQNNTDANFGSIADKLPNGTYTFVFSAGKTGLTIYPSSPTSAPYEDVNYPVYFNDVSLSYFKYEPPVNESLWHDTFYKSLTLKVAGGAISQSVVLERLVGQLEIKVNDIVPSNVTSIVTTISNEWRESYLSGNNLGLNNVFTKTIPAGSGASTFQLNTIIGNTVSPLKVQIICYDSKKNIIASTTVDNVTVKKNTKTILSGNLFGSSTTGSFQISLNNTWDPKQTVINF